MSELLLENVTKLAVIVGYTVVIAAAADALLHSSMWSRRVSSVAILIIGVIWFAFYIWLFVTRHHTVATTPILLSRVAHYITAATLVTMASMIARSERYGMKLMGNGNDVG